MSHENVMDSHQFNFKQLVANSDKILALCSYPQQNQILDPASFTPSNGPPPPPPDFTARITFGSTALYYESLSFGAGTITLPCSVDFTLRSLYPPQVVSLL